MVDNINSLKNYGIIHMKLDQLLQERGMNKNQLARAIDSRFEVVKKWCKSDVEKIDADVLARICYVLHCRVEDILEYKAIEVPVEEKPTPVEEKPTKE